METIHHKVMIGEDGKLRLEVGTRLPPGPVEVVIVLNPVTPSSGRSVMELAGLGKEIWEGIDAQEYVDRLREGRDL